MAVKPVIMSIDDDPQVLRAVERDLRREYGKDYRIMAIDSGQQALETLKELKLRNQPVALFLVDQRMPGMTGVEFLQKAIDIFPDTKRVLLTAYADKEAAISAINSVHLDYYLMKPWDPPEENLYPVVADMLEYWGQSYRAPFEGVRLIGHRWSPQAHEIKDFLSRNLIPYQFMDVESSEEVKKLVETTQLDISVLPLVLFPDGTKLANPSLVELAPKVGLRTRATQPFYDLVIVGGGPAGLAAAVYGASEGLHTVLIEKEAPGGQAGTSSRIENYLGFPVGLSGADLARRAVAQAQRFGVEIITPGDVCGLRVEDPYRYIQMYDGSEVSCHALVISTGVSYRKFDAPGIEILTGAGVYYGAAMTEAMSTQGQEIFLIGGANSAGQAAMYFSRYANTVNILVRGDSLEKGMSQYLVDQIHSTPNIRVWLNTSCVEARGSGRLEYVVVKNSVTGDTQTLPAAALFIFIGAEPRTDWVANALERDKQGFILTGPDLVRGGQRPKGWNLDRDPFLLESSVPGVFCAGDVRHDSIKRIASAVGEGAMAVRFIHEHLANL